MSTHNIGFYEDLTKIIFELSSNIIKYAPYFFCCHDDDDLSCLPWTLSTKSNKQHQSSKCPSLPGFTHWVNPGKPGLGFKPYFGKKWGILGNRIF